MLFRYYSNPPGDLPDMGVACSLFVTHIAAGILTLALSFRSGTHRRTTEFWIVVTYWAAIAAMIILFQFGVTESVARWAGIAVVVIAIGFPVVSLSGMITRGMRRGRTMQPSDQDPP
jgi:uncharacterized membrane protein YhaH (DUF805 family)